MISIAKETLVFRRARVSLALRLLVPTFLLPYAPAWVTPLPSVRMEYSPTTYSDVKSEQIRSFGTMLKPRSSLAQGLLVSELLRFL
jgi:hypothetical protein